MTDHTLHTTGETLDEMHERVVFTDPATHGIREEWEETKREVMALFERECAEQFDLRLKYHRGCGEPEAEELAQRDTDLIRPMLEEDRERRLALVWAEVLRRVQALLATKTSPSSGGLNGQRPER